MKGTLRGVHFQRGDRAQAKLLRCVRGAVLDVAVDLRPSSTAPRQHGGIRRKGRKTEELKIEQSLAGRGQLYAPAGLGSVACAVF